MGFEKAVRLVGFFVKDLDLGLFDPFKDVKGGVLLDEEEIVAEEDAVDEEHSAEERGNDTQVLAPFCLFSSFLHGWTLAT